MPLKNPQMKEKGMSNEKLSKGFNVKKEIISFEKN